MDSEQKQFLSLPQPPARLTSEQAAWYLGFQPHDMPILVVAGLLKPLGNPPANALKHFATSALDDIRQDTKWLARASDTIHRHWKHKNSQRGEGASHRVDQPLPATNTTA